MQTQDMLSFKKMYSQHKQILKHVHNHLNSLCSMSWNKSNQKEKPQLGKMEKTM
jgi:hypothetical protein